MSGRTAAPAAGEPTLEEIRGRLVDAVYLTLLLFSVAVMGFHLYRSAGAVIDTNMVPTAAAYLIIFVIWLFRHRIRYGVKAAVLITLLLLLQLNGMRTWGLLSAGEPLFVLAAVLATSFYGIRAGVIVVALCFALTAGVALGVSASWVRFDLDWAAYATAPTAWVGVALAVVVFGLLAVVTVGRVDAALVSTTRRLRKRNAELVKARDAANAAAVAKTRFLANAGHELRTPLNSILGLGEILERADLTREERQELKTLNASAVHLARLVDDLIAIARGEVVPTEKSITAQRIRLDEVLASADGRYADLQAGAPASPSGSTSDSGPVIDNPGAAADLLRRLSALIGASDMAAADLVDELIELTAGHACQHQARELRDRIRAFDYDAAADAMPALEAHLAQLMSQGDGGGEDG